MTAGPDRRHPVRPPGIPPDLRCLAAANIWQVGIIMRCLLRLEDEDALNDDPPAIDYYNVPRTNANTITDSWVPQVNPHELATPRVEGYSQNMIDLVRECLRVDTTGAYARPDPVTLLNRIRTVRVPHIRGTDTRTRKFTWNDRSLLERLDLTDPYRLGMSAAGFPPQRP